MKSKEELKQLFENGDIPKQEEFWEWQDSYFHKDEKIPQDTITDLETSLNSKLDAPDPSLSGSYIINKNTTGGSYQ